MTTDLAVPGGDDLTTRQLLDVLGEPDRKPAGFRAATSNQCTWTGGPGRTAESFAARMGVTKASSGAGRLDLQRPPSACWCW